MKKYLIIFLCLILNMNYILASNINSNNAFVILIDDTPNNKPIIDDKNNDATLGIVLGSTFGSLALGGLGYYLYRKGQKISCCLIKDRNNFLFPICYDKRKKDNDKNLYELTRILNSEELDKKCVKKYIFLEDTCIKNKTLNRVFFKVDEDYSKIRIIQYSKQYDIEKNIPNLNTRLFMEEQELGLSSSCVDFNQGILIKEGKHNFKKDQYYFFDTVLLGKQKENKYALVLEFSK